MREFTLQTHGEVFAEAQTLTGTATLGNQNAKPEVGRHLGSLAVTLIANGPVTAAANSHVTIAAETADTTDDAAFKPLVTFSTQGKADFAAGFTAANGRKLARLPLPDAARYVRVKLSGAGITGKVDCVLEYLAR